MIEYRTEGYLKTIDRIQQHTVCKGRRTNIFSCFNFARYTNYNQIVNQTRKLYFLISNCFQI